MRNCSGERGPKCCCEGNNGLEITRSEKEHAIATAKRGKAPGPDGLRIDVLQVLRGKYLKLS